MMETSLKFWGASKKRCRGLRRSKTLRHEVSTSELTRLVARRTGTGYERTTSSPHRAARMTRELGRAGAENPSLMQRGIRAGRGVQLDQKNDCAQVRSVRRWSLWHQPRNPHPLRLNWQLRPRINDQNDCNNRQNRVERQTRLGQLCGHRHTTAERLVLAWGVSIRGFRTVMILRIVVGIS